MADESGSARQRSSMAKEAVFNFILVLFSATPAPFGLVIQYISRDDLLSALEPLMSINSVCMCNCVEGAVDIMSQANFRTVLQSHVHVLNIVIYCRKKTVLDVAASIRSSMTAAAGAHVAIRIAATVG